VSAPASNQKHTSEAAAIGAQVAKAVAWVSGIFSLVACITLILAQIQIMQVDPLNDPTLKAMKAQITKDQQNQQLRDSVRSLHLPTRRASSRTRPSARTGVMLLFGVAIFLARHEDLRGARPLPMPQGRRRARRIGGRAAGGRSSRARRPDRSPPCSPRLSLPARNLTAGRSAKAPAGYRRAGRAGACQEGRAEERRRESSEPSPTRCRPRRRSSLRRRTRGPSSAVRTATGSPAIKAPLAWDGAKGENIA
jgi:hypothetical protein